LVNSILSLNQVTFGVGLPVIATLSLMFSPALIETPSKYSWPNWMFGGTERQKNLYFLIYTDQHNIACKMLTTGRWETQHKLHELTALISDDNITRRLRGWAHCADSISCYDSKFIAFTASKTGHCKFCVSHICKIAL